MNKKTLKTSNRRHELQLFLIMLLFHLSITDVFSAATDAIQTFYHSDKQHHNYHPITTPSTTPPISTITTSSHFIYTNPNNNKKRKQRKLRKLQNRNQNRKRRQLFISNDNPNDDFFSNNDNTNEGDYNGHYETLQLRTNPLQIQFDTPVLLTRSQASHLCTCIKEKLELEFLGKSYTVNVPHPDGSNLDMDVEVYSILILNMRDIMMKNNDQSTSGHGRTRTRTRKLSTIPSAQIRVSGMLFFLDFPSSTDTTITASDIGTVSKMIIRNQVMNDIQATLNTPSSSTQVKELYQLRMTSSSTSSGEELSLPWNLKLTWQNQGYTLPPSSTPSDSYDYGYGISSSDSGSDDGLDDDYEIPLDDTNRENRPTKSMESSNGTTTNVVLISTFTLLALIIFIFTSFHYMKHYQTNTKTITRRAMNAEDFDDEGFPIHPILDERGEPTNLPNLSREKLDRVISWFYYQVREGMEIILRRNNDCDSSLSSRSNQERISYQSTSRLRTDSFCSRDEEEDEGVEIILQPDACRVPPSHLTESSFGESRHSLYSF